MLPLQISRREERKVQRHLVVTTQVKIMAEKLHCPAVFNSGLCHTLSIQNRSTRNSRGYDSYQNSAQYRGRGARMVATFNLSRGEIDHILVGQEGGKRHNGVGGGGGGTFVVQGSNTSLIVAGGGGGVKSVTVRHQGCDASTNTSGNPGHKSWSGGGNGHGAETGDDKPSGESDRVTYCLCFKTSLRAKPFTRKCV